MKEKSFFIAIFLFGLISITYGMVRDNNIVFVGGIILFLAGYILMRKRLKDSIRDKNDAEN